MARCQYLGVPDNPSKTEGPCTKLVFLGIELDTISLTMCLPRQVGASPEGDQSLGGKKCCTKRGLLSIIGQLQHACCVIKQGRSFLRRMIELSRGVRELHHRVRLNAGFHSDLQWWNCFLPFWNGSCLMARVAKREPQVVLTTDAPGSWGCGAFTSEGEWFQLELPQSWQGVHINSQRVVACCTGHSSMGEPVEGVHSVLHV